MSNKNSSTGGFLQPSPREPTLVTTPPELTLLQFIQTVMVGISGLPGTLVVPDWQVEPPKTPDINVDWMAYGIQTNTPDFDAYISQNGANDGTLQRNELLQISISVYGPQAYANAGLLRDGFQLTQNLASLKAANMGFAYDSPAQHSPDFVNGRWNDRYIMDIFLRRQIQRVYPILNFLSASGTIHTQTSTDQNFAQNWKAGS